MTQIIHGSGGGGGAVDSDTLKLSAVAKGVYLFSEGPVGGLVDGAKSIYLNDVPLVDANGNAAYQGVAWTFRDGAPDQAFITGFSDAVTYVNDGREVFQDTPVVIPIANGSQEYDAAYVVIQIPVLNVKSKSGNYRKQTVSFQIAVRGGSGSYVTVHNVTMNEKSSAVWEGTYRVDLPTGFTTWDIKVTRISANSMDAEDDSGMQIQNRTLISRYATVTSGKFTYRNSCVMGIQYDAKTFGTSIPSVKALMDGIKVWVPTNYDPVTRTYATSGAGTSGGIWDGTFKAAVTDNPVWHYYDLIVNNRYGLGDDFNPNYDPGDALADKWNLYAISQYCDELVPDGNGGTEPRYTSSMQLTVQSAQEAYDLLQSMLSSIHTMIYFSNNQIMAVTDKSTSPVQSFNQSDVKDGTFNYSGTSFKNRNTVYTVTYKDSSQKYKTTMAMYEYTPGVARFGYRIKAVEVIGCTRRSQAIRAARWQAFTEHLQTQTVTFTAGHKGATVTPGDVIRIHDDYKSMQRLGGRILASSVEDTGTYSGKTKLTIDATVTFPALASVVYYTTDGVMVTHTLANSGATSNVIYLSTVDAEQALIGSTFVITSSAYDGTLWRVIARAENNDEESTFSFTCLEHDETKYTVVDSDLALPDPYVPVISEQALSPVDSVTYTPYFEEVSGARSLAKVSISWPHALFQSTYPVVGLRGQIDYRVIGYELELKTPEHDYAQVYRGVKREWASGQLEPITTSAYQARVRSYDQLGRVSKWVESETFGLVGKSIYPDPPSGVSITSIIRGIQLSWTNASDVDFWYTEVRMSTTNDYATAPVVGEISDNSFVLADIPDDALRYFFLTTVTHATTNNRSSTYATASASRGQVAATDLDADITNSLDQTLQAILIAQNIDLFVQAMTYTGDGRSVQTVSLTNEAQTADAIQRLNLLGAMTSDASAFVINLATAMVGEQTFASFIDGVSATLDGLTSSVTTNSEAIAGLSAKWTMTVSSGGNIAGIQAGATTYSFLSFIAENFGFYDPSDPANPKVLATMDSSKIVLGTDVEIRGDLIVLGDITTAHLTVNAVTNYASATVSGITNIGTEQTAASISGFNPLGGRVEIAFRLAVDNTGGSAAAIRVKIFRNGVNISGSLLEYSQTSFTKHFTSYIVDESAPTSPCTYSISIQTVTGTGIGDTGGTAYAANLAGGNFTLTTFKR